MDLSKLKKKMFDGIGKYKYPLLILCIGLAFIWIPTGSSASKVKSSEITQSQEIPYISQDDLAEILSRIKGTGRVEVLLSLEYTDQTEYQQNREFSGGSNERENTVTVTDAQRNESGLISKKYAPVYRGAIVVCDGADDPTVHLSVINAVSNITGLGSHQISVLKME